MDTNKLLCLIAGFIPVALATSAVIAKEALYIDPPETIYDVISKAPAEKRRELMQKHDACIDLSFTVYTYIYPSINATFDYIEKLEKGDQPNADEYSSRLEAASKLITMMWDEDAKIFERILTKDVIDNAFPRDEVMQLAKELEALSHDIKQIRDPKKLERIAHSIVDRAKELMMDGYVRCLKYSGILQLFI
jgi:hypothetical protein